MLSEILYAARNNAIKGNDVEVAVVLDELNKRITPNSMYIKVKKYEAEYLKDFVEGIRQSLEEAVDFLNAEETPRENKDELIAVATEKQQEALEIAEMITGKIRGT
jgi:predicted nucleotidyltransferase